MDFTQYLEELGINSFFQGINELFSFNDILLMILVLLMLLILVSLLSIRRRSRKLLETNRKMLYELNQLNANIPSVSSLMAERTDPMY